MYAVPESAQWTRGSETHLTFKCHITGGHFYNFKARDFNTTTINNKK